MSASDLAVLVLAMPGPVQTERVDLSGYSLGPVPSEEVTESILEAIPSEEGNVHFIGRIEWSGLSSVKQSVLTGSQSMAAITDLSIMFLWWSEVSERYEVLIRLAFTDIYSIQLWTPGFGTNIRFCHETDEIPLGDQFLTIERKTTLRVLKTSGFVDAEKTREVFLLLDNQLITRSESPSLQGPCDGAAVSGGESPRGFGNCDPALEECQAVRVRKPGAAPFASP